MTECPNKDAWDGGYKDEDNSPTYWSDGYEGFLWTKWAIIDGEKYEKTSEFQCSKCPNPVVNSIKVFGVMVLVLSFILILIAINIK